MKPPPLNATITPWDLPIPERMQALCKKSSKNRVLYLYEKADSSTFRYRVYNIFQALSSSDSWQGSYFFSDELEYLDSCLKSIDLIVIVRFRWSFQLDTFILKAKKLNIPIIFDVDDLVFDIQTLPLLMNTLGIAPIEEKYSAWFSYVARINHTATLCDATLSTNAFLRNKLCQKFEKPSFVIPNFLNREQLSRSESLYQKNEKRNQSDSFTIGYFSGSPSHKNDFVIALPEIVNFLSEYPQATLEVVGFMEFPDYLQSFLETKQIYLTSFVDFLTLQDKISNVEVNIVPLLDNEFTNCKSELKFFEAAVVGTPTCASPTYVFKENIVHGQTGYLCEEGKWYESLKTIYENRMDYSISKNAKEYCIKKYAYYNQTALIEGVFDQIIANN